LVKEFAYSAFNGCKADSNIFIYKYHFVILQLHEQKGFIMTIFTELLSEETLDTLQSFEEPLEQHIRSNCPEFVFECILLGGMCSKSGQTADNDILVEIRFEEVDDNISKLLPSDVLMAECKAFLENKISEGEIFHDYKNPKFQYLVEAE